MDAGAGNDKITLNGSSANNYIIGGDGNDTIIINNSNQNVQGSKKLYNLVKGGTGNDTYIIQDVDSQVIIDNLHDRNDNDNDALKINTGASGKSLSELMDSEILYDKTHDILKCRNFYVVGFSKLTNVIDINGDVERAYSVNDPLIGLIHALDDNKYSADFSFSGFIDDMNAISDNWEGNNGIIHSGFSTDSLAVFAGYTKA